MPKGIGYGKEYKMSKMKKKTKKKAPTKKYTKPPLSKGY